MEFTLFLLTWVWYLFNSNRRSQSKESESNNGNSSLGFRHLEANERNQDAMASNEPIYELESPVAAYRESSVPLFAENIYSDPTEEQDIADATVGLYSEPSEWNKGLYGETKVRPTEAPPGDLMVNDNANNEYEEVMFNCVSRVSFTGYYVNNNFYNKHINTVYNAFYISIEQ